MCYTILLMTVMHAMSSK